MKKLLTFALCAALAFALCCAPAAAYSDVSDGAWYAEAVGYCTDNGLMDGMGDGTFAPDAPVTRAQLVTVLWRLAGKPAAPALEDYADVAPGSWYAEAVGWAASAGVTEGVGNKRFAPDTPLTREMLATFFHRFAGAPAAAGTADFTDRADIADWAQTAAAWAAESGLMQGRGGGVFDPKGGAVRAELAQVLMNYAAGQSAVSAALALRTGAAPVGVAVASDGALLVTDGFHKVVWRVADGGSEIFAGLVTVADENGEPYGGYLDGAAERALFASPWGIAPFLGGWAVSDPDNNTVRLVLDGQVQTLNGIEFARPTGLAAGEDGVLYVANTGAGTVLCVTPEGKSSIVASGFAGPTGLAWADGALYIAETDAGNVWKLTDGGKTLVSGEFYGPTGLAVGEDGTIYVADTADAAVYAVAPGGALTALLERAAGPDLAAWPAAPAGLALRGGVLTVCDSIPGVVLDVPLGK